MNQKYKDCCAKPNIFILKSGPNPKKLWLDWCWQVGSDKERLKGRIGSGDANGQSMKANRRSCIQLLDLLYISPDGKFNNTLKRPESVNWEQIWVYIMFT